MSGDGAATTVAARLGLGAGQLVGEIGYDDDVDHDLRTAVEALVESEIIDLDNNDDVVDAVLLWWRDDDGDVADGLVDALTLLADIGRGLEVHEIDEGKMLAAIGWLKDRAGAS